MPWTVSTPAKDGELPSTVASQQELITAGQARLCGHVRSCDWGCEGGKPFALNSPQLVHTIFTASHNM